MPLLQSLSTEDEPVAPLKSPREESKLMFVCLFFSWNCHMIWFHEIFKNFVKLQHELMNLVAPLKSLREESKLMFVCFSWNYIQHELIFQKINSCCNFTKFLNVKNVAKLQHELIFNSKY